MPPAVHLPFSLSCGNTPQSTKTAVLSSLVSALLFSSGTRRDTLPVPGPRSPVPASSTYSYSSGQLPAICHSEPFFCCTAPLGLRLSFYALLTIYPNIWILTACWPRPVSPAEVQGSYQILPPSPGDLQMPEAAASRTSGFRCARNLLTAPSRTDDPTDAPWVNQLMRSPKFR